MERTLEDLVERAKQDDQAALEEMLRQQGPLKWLSVSNRKWSCSLHHFLSSIRVGHRKRGRGPDLHTVQCDASH